MRVSSIQLAIQDRPKEETLPHVLALLDQARGSDLILLPEHWPFGFLSFARYDGDSEDLDGPTVRTLRAKARELNAYLFMGSFVERGPHFVKGVYETGLFNTSVLINPLGEIAGRYRKIHLFGHEGEEKRLLQPGTEIVVVPTPWGRAGLSICYDLRFPELYRKMMERGADFFLVASAWPAVRLESWILFNRARANENLAYLFSCNCAGSQGEHRYGGHSLFVDPLGKVIAEAGDGECILSAVVDPGLTARVRKDFPALNDRVIL
jgi:predicted amidohydrolase